MSRPSWRCKELREDFLAPFTALQAAQLRRRNILTHDSPCVQSSGCHRSVRFFLQGNLFHSFEGVVSKKHHLHFTDTHWSTDCENVLRELQSVIRNTSGNTHAGAPRDMDFFRWTTADNVRHTEFEWGIMAVQEGAPFLTGCGHGT